MNRITYLGLMTLLLMASVVGAVTVEEEHLVEIRVSAQNTLIGLCQKYLIQPEKWKRVAALNRLADPNRLNPGQKLVIPAALLKGVPMEGTVTFLKGDVLTQLPGSPLWRPLQLQERVQEGALLKTGRDGTLEVLFEDGSSILLREHSLLKVAASKKGALHFLRILRLEGGRVISRIKAATGKDSRFEIETPSALAAARGTHYRVAVDEQQTTRAELLESSIAVSAMGATVALKEGEGTVTRLNEPPAPPVRLLGPPLARDLPSVYGDRSNSIHFSSVENAAQYRISLALDREGTNIVRTSLIKPDEPFVFEGLADGSYYLFAGSIGPEGLEGAPSQPLEIKVRRKPLPPEIVIPQDKTALPEMPMKIQWQQILGVSAYQLQIATTPDFGGTLLESGDVEKTVFTTKELVEGTYYLRIRSLAEGGYRGDWSPVRTFTVAKLAAPSLQKSGGDDKLYVAWEALQGVDRYHLQIARDATFGSILLERTVQEPRLVLETPPEPGRYYMRVSPQGAGWENGGFSKSGSFEIEKKKHYYLESLGFAGSVGLLLLLVLL